MCVRVNVCMHVYACVYACVCMCVFVRVYVQLERNGEPADWLLRNVTYSTREQLFDSAIAIDLRFLNKGMENEEDTKIF